MDVLKYPPKPNFKEHCFEHLMFLKSYAEKHFNDEESYLRSINYPDFDSHKKLHTKLAVDVLRFEKELMASDFSPLDLKKFMGFVVTWLTYHVAGEDRKFSKADEPIVPVKTEQSKVIGVDEFIKHFAMATIQVLKTVTGLMYQDISIDIRGDKFVNPEICFRACMNSKFNKCIGIKYSGEIAAGVFKSITGTDACEINEIIISSLSELSSIISSRFAGVVSSYGIPCDVESPLQVPADDIPASIDRFIAETRIGSLEIILFDNYKNKG